MYKYNIHLYSKETIELTYVNSQISNIKTKNGTTVITYNNKNIIEKITDITGKSVGYEYYDTIPYRFEFIESWYNNKRIHSTLGYITPNQKYNNYITNLAIA